MESYKSVTFTVPKDMIGLIIGVKGANIKQVQKMKGVCVAASPPCPRRGLSRKIALGTMIALPTARLCLSVQRTAGARERGREAVPSSCARPVRSYDINISESGAQGKITITGTSDEVVQAAKEELCFEQARCLANNLVASKSPASSGVAPTVCP